MPFDPHDCARFAPELSAWIDGELADGLEAELQEHLAGCGRCRARVDALRAVDAGLASLPAPDLPGDLRARLQARIDAPPAETADPPPSARAPGRRAPARSRGGRWLGSRGLAALASAAAALALYWAVAGDEAATPALAPETRDAPTLAQVEPAPVVEPVPSESAPEPPPEPVQVARAPSPEPTPSREPTPRPALAQALEDEPVDDLALALELETVEDLEVIANLELLEALLMLDEGTG
jgi:hypothetical protein